MATISNDDFNRHLQEFNNILVSNLQLIDPAKPARVLQIKNNFVKSHQENAYSVTSVLVDSSDETYNFKITFSVSYHPFYGVPVCNFQVFSVGQDGLEKAISDWNFAKVGSSKVVLDTHHLLDTPWYSVHPCETLQTLKEFFEGHTNIYPVRYLVLWFGLYGIPSVFPEIQLRVVTNDKYGL